MSEASDAVIERVKVRELVGIFRTREALEDAVDALLLAGFDRADIELMASVDAVREKLGGIYAPAEELADIPGVPRRAFLAREDVTLPLAPRAGILTYVGATAAALGIVASGGALAAAAVAAAAGGAIAGGFGALIARVIGREQAKELERQMAAGGLVLFVRARSPDQEEKAQQILHDHGAEAVRVHEVEIDKRLSELPLSSLRPDPWLGSEPLGQPWAKPGLRMDAEQVRRGDTVETAFRSAARCRAGGFEPNLIQAARRSSTSSSSSPLVRETTSIPVVRNVFIVDDDAPVGRSLERLLRSAGFVAVVYESPFAFLDAAPKLSAGCVLLELWMPEMDGLELQARLNHLGFTLPVIVVTGHGDIQTAVQAMKAGAVDFIEKPFDDQYLLAAIEVALSKTGRVARDRGVIEAVRRITALSPREREVLDALVAGRPNKIIASDLGISVRTVEVHRVRMLERLGANSLAEAIRLAVLAALAS